MMKSYLSIALAALFVGLPLTTVAAPFSLEQAIDTGVEKSPDVAIAKQSAVAEAFKLRSAKSKFLFTVSLDANLQYWDSETAVSFGSSDGGGDSGGIDMSDPAIADLFSGISPECMGCTIQTLQLMGDFMPIVLGSMMGGETVVQEQLTWSTTVAVVQPLTLLYPIWLGYKAQEVSVQNAQVGVTKASIDARMQIIEAYYSWVEAHMMAETVESSVELVQALVDQAQKFYDVQLIQKFDLLSAEVQLASIQQGLESAKMGIAIARQALDFAMGGSLPADAEPAPLPKTEPKPFEKSLAECIEEAQSARLELVQLKNQIKQATYGRDAQWASSFIPQVLGMFTYMHSEGSTFQAPNKWFVGLTLSWNVWEWGSSYYAVQATDASIGQLTLAIKKVEDAIKLEVTSNYLLLDTARKNLAITEQNVAKAEEALDLENKRYAAQINTSTDVLDAQTAVVRTKIEHQKALLQYHLYREKLLNSMGRK